MLGGHLDSWHSATGATDNAIGSRDDARGDSHPAGDRRQAAPHDSRGAVERRRTGAARIAGVREGALRHGRESEARARATSPATSTSTPAPAARAARRCSARPKRPRSCAKRPKPFADNGFFGVNATQSRRRGGTDSTSFNEAGLPGIGIQQDPIEYSSHTWHTNLDTYERIIERRCAAVGDGDRRGGVSPGDARSDAAAAAEGQDAAAADAVSRSVEVR